MAPSQHLLSVKLQLLKQLLHVPVNCATPSLVSVYYIYVGSSVASNGFQFPLNQSIGVHDRGIKVDNTPIEMQIRRTAVAGKNYLFAGFVATEEPLYIVPKT